MKFLLDQNLSPQTTRFLRRLGLESTDIRDVGLSGKEDDVIYDYARKGGFVLITYDHDFIYKYIFQKNLEGLILIRLHPQTLEETHNLLKMFFSSVELKQIENSIVVVERHRFRIRKVK